MSGNPALSDERRDTGEVLLSSYFEGSKHYFDMREQLTVVKIFTGDWYVSRKPGEMCATILGSCVSVCIRDPIAGVGGMNHFLLPGDDNANSKVSDSARYGVYAMESLINGILKAGERKDRFELKAFGGGNVLNTSSRIGSRNAQFIRNFLFIEGLPIVAEDLEGDLPRRVHYYPDTGKVMVRQLKRQEDLSVLIEEDRYKQKITTQPLVGDVELF